MKHPEHRWYKDGFFWRKEDGDRDGTGDIIFNTCTHILETDDTSRWAYSALYVCADLLLQHKRWPDSLNTGYEAPNMIRYWLGKYRYKPQKRMSRDPFIAVFTLDAKLNAGVIEELAPVWWIYNPAFWNWYLYLKTGFITYKLLYAFFDVFSLSEKDYVQRLDVLKKQAIKFKEHER